MAGKGESSSAGQWMVALGFVAAAIIAVTVGLWIGGLPEGPGTGEGAYTYEAESPLPGLVEGDGEAQDPNERR